MAQRRRDSSPGRPRSYMDDPARQQRQDNYPYENDNPSRQRPLSANAMSRPVSRGADAPMISRNRLDRAESTRGQRAADDLDLPSAPYSTAWTSNRCDGGENSWERARTLEQNSRRFNQDGTYNEDYSTFDEGSFDDGGGYIYEATLHVKHRLHAFHRCLLVHCVSLE